MPNKYSQYERDFRDTFDKYNVDADLRFNIPDEPLTTEQLMAMCSFYLGLLMGQRIKIKELEEENKALDGVYTTTIIVTTLFGDAPYEVGDDVNSKVLYHGTVKKVEPNPDIDNSFLVTIEYSGFKTVLETENIDDPQEYLPV